MTADVALLWDNETWQADLALRGGDLAADDSLQTAVIVSLFTDRRARPDDVLPQGGADPRGWWADMLAEEGEQIGSRLWLLSREKQTPETVARAREYAEEALAWLVREGVAELVEVEASILRAGVLGLAIWISRPGGPDRQRFDYVWKFLT